MDLPTDDDGLQALDYNQNARRYQNAVVSGCSVSPGTNDLTVQVSSSSPPGEVIVDGGRFDISDQDNISLSSADPSNPRKDVVYVDSSGNVQVATGTAEAPRPSGEVRRDTYRPAPPDLSSTTATVLAEVWVPAGATDITSSDVSDRRQFADITAGDVDANSLDVDTVTSSSSTSIGVNEKLDLSGSSANLRIATGQSIEDGGGTERVRFLSVGTFLDFQDGAQGFDLNKGNFNRLHAYSSTPIVLLDDEGDHDAVTLKTSSSAPSTFELTNAILQLLGTGASNGIQGEDQGGGTKPALYVNSNGEWVARDDSGNTTVIS